MALTNLTISYPDFQLNTTIDPEQFDTNNLEIVTKINAIIAEINASTTASEVVLTPITGVTGSDIQTFLNNFKTYVDTQSYTKSESDAKYALSNDLINLVLGQIPNGSITNVKIQDGTIANEKIQDAVITASKMANDMKKGISGGIASYDSVYTINNNLITTTGLVNRINGLYLRNNAGTLEWSTDNATWNAVGGGGIGSFEFGLPII